MSILNNSLLLGADAGAGGYQISRSLRFNSADSAFLSRTPASAGNRKTWTYSLWVKRSALGVEQHIFSAGVPAVADDGLNFDSSDRLSCYTFRGSLTSSLVTTQVFRDCSAWYHFLWAWDTDNATTALRSRLYVNGVEITAFSTSSYPASGTSSDINSNVDHSIGDNRPNFTTGNFSGYLADIHFIDGQALTPSSFAETNATTGQWVPKAYTGSYGTNGFKLSFSNNASTTTISQDSSGNNNHWTANNISVTAGAGNDALMDHPVSSGTDTGAGGEVRGNYATLNPLTGNTYSASYKNGNLDFDTNGIADDGLHVFGTFQLPASGKWYWETTFSLGAGFPGINSNATRGNNTQLSTMRVYNSNGQIGGVGGSATWTTGDVIGAAYDADAGTLSFYKNGSLQPVSISSVGFSTGPWWPQVRQDRTATCSVNFGQRPFAYTAPSGFKALCDTNLPAPTIAKPSTVMDVKLYTGNGSTQTISGLGFSPDLVWIKTRSIGYYNVLYDTVRGTGTGKALYSNTTDAEGTDSTLQNLTAFNSDGFSLGTTSGTNIINDSSQTRVAWAWDAGSSTVTNTQGSITSQVRANASAGFSVVSWSGVNGANGTIGHGVGVAPQFVILKNRGTTDNWRVYHVSVGATGFLQLASTGATVTSDEFQNTSPTSTVFYLRGNTWNAASNNYIAYCFAPAAGYSAFGSYTGNGSADGPFVYTGFRPRWVMVKRTDAARDWFIYDAARNTFNIVNNYLRANLSDAEGTNTLYPFDFLSNGFKLRSSETDINGSGGTWIYAAFAENPFQYARAR